MQNINKLDIESEANYFIEIFQHVKNSGITESTAEILAIEIYRKLYLKGFSELLSKKIDSIIEKTINNKP